MSQSPTPITSVADILNPPRLKTFDELIEEVWLEQVKAIADLADEMERNARQAVAA